MDQEQSQDLAGDISSLDVAAHAEEGLDVPIVNPKTGEKIGLVIKVMGVYAGRFQEMLAKQRKRDAMRQKNGALMKALSQEGNDTAETAEILAEVTIGWSGMLEAGKAIPFSKKEAQRIYEKYPVIRGQVLGAAMEVANFIRD